MELARLTPHLCKPAPETPAAGPGKDASLRMRGSSCLHIDTLVHPKPGRVPCSQARLHVGATWHFKKRNARPTAEARLSECGRPRRPPDVSGAQRVRRAACLRATALVPVLRSHTGTHTRTLSVVTAGDDFTRGVQPGGRVLLWPWPPGHSAPHFIPTDFQRA